MPSSPDKDLKVFITKSYTADVYLACSWRSRSGQDASWLLVKELDQKGQRVVGDVPDFSEQDDDRIERIMGGCAGFAVILPFREENPNKTSPYIIRELKIAAKLGIPMLILHDSSFPVEIVESSGTKELVFSSMSKLNPIPLDSATLFGPIKFDEDQPDFKTMISTAVEGFSSSTSRYSPKRVPFAFLITQLNKDFALAREAIKLAVEHEAGIPCLWSDDNQHSTNVEGIREGVRLLIKQASFVVADFTYGLETSASDNPSRALELGMAIAYKRPTILFAQGPRRDPFFSGRGYPHGFLGRRSRLIPIGKKCHS